MNFEVVSKKVFRFDQTLASRLHHVSLSANPSLRVEDDNFSYARVEKPRDPDVSRTQRKIKKMTNKSVLSTREDLSIESKQQHHSPLTIFAFVSDFTFYSISIVGFCRSRIVAA